MAVEAPRLNRRFLLPDALLLIAELTALGVPLVVFVSLTVERRALLYGVLPAALALAAAVWFLATRAWRAPIGRAARRRLMGDVLDARAREEAHRALLAFP